MGVPGKELDPETAKRLKEIQPGGFIIFGRNIESPDQLRKYIDDLRDLSEIEPFITIDQEGGRVSRLRLIGEEPPNAQALRKKGDQKLIARHGKLTGQLLRLFGFNLDLCPVLDVSHDDEADNSLKGRCYGTNTQEVVSNAGVFNRSMRKEGILSCGKHFPGYSNAECDPHEELPFINRTRDELESEEILPFRTLLPELDSIMMCHSCYPAYDPDAGRLPASLSKNIVTNLLRNQLGYDKGLIMTDDLDMGAILNEVTFENTIIGAIEAGNDLAMICHRVEMVEQAKKHLEDVEDLAISDALEHIHLAKKRLVTSSKWSLEAFQDINKDIWELRVDTLGEEEAKNLSVEDGKRSPVELY